MQHNNGLVLVIEEINSILDIEVKKIIDEAYVKAKDELTAHIEKLKALARALLEKEVLDAEEVRAIVGIPTPAV